MNYKMVSHTLGVMLKVNAFLMLVPLVVSIIYAEKSAYAFLVPIALSFGIGALMSARLPKKKAIYAREGMVIVAFTWILFSIFGAMPFTISGYIPNFVDSFFEVVSGFTTTGSTILSDIESLPNGLLFWRSFTHWIGGMGVLVFALAVLPRTHAQSMQIMKAEVPGPTVGKLVSRVRSTAQILYGIYVALTAIQVILLILGGMPIFDSIVTSFSTAGTGGFGIKNTSIAAYDSYYIDMVIAIFMMIFAINFNLYFLMLNKNFKEALQSEELHFFVGIVAVATLVITISIRGLYPSIAQAFRYAFFQVTSIISSTGFATADYMKWAPLTQGIFMILMMIGACAGSTGGGIKVSRIIIMFKSVARNIKKNVHPNWVMPITIDNKSLEDDVINSVGIYIMLFSAVFVASVTALTALGMDLETAFGAVNGTINNIGPGLKLLGPAGNFSHLSNPMKLILCFDMLAGRLEFYPIMALFFKSTWRR